MRWGQRIWREAVGLPGQRVGAEDRGQKAEGKPEDAIEMPKLAQTAF